MKAYKVYGSSQGVQIEDQNMYKQPMGSREKKNLLLRIRKG